MKDEDGIWIFASFCFKSYWNVSAVTAGYEEERAPKLTSSFIKPSFFQTKYGTAWFPWAYSFRKTWRVYSSCVENSQAQSVSEFSLFMCAPIHCKLPNGSKLTPDSTIRDFHRDNFQRGPLKMFCTWCSFLGGGLLESIEMGSPYGCAPLSKSEE